VIISVSSTKTVPYTATVRTETFTSTTKTIDVLPIISSTTATTTTTTSSDIVTATVVSQATFTPPAGPAFYLYVTGLTPSIDDGYLSMEYNFAVSNIGPTPGAGASTFVLDAAGQLFTAGFGSIAGSFSGSAPQNVFFGPTTGGYYSGFEPLTCNTDDMVLSCSSNNGAGDILYIDTGEAAIVGYLGIGSAVPSDAIVVPINVYPA